MWTTFSISSESTPWIKLLLILYVIFFLTNIPVHIFTLSLLFYTCHAKDIFWFKSWNQAKTSVEITEISLFFVIFTDDWHFPPECGVKCLRKICTKTTVFILAMSNIFSDLKLWQLWIDSFYSIWSRQSKNNVWHIKKDPMTT